MRRYINKTLSLISVLMVIFSAISCSKEHNFQFKELCFYHPHTAPVRIGVDWSQFTHIETPSGMTVYVWPMTTDDQMSRFVTHNIGAVTLDLKAGLYNAFVFNQTDSEYATIEFHNLDEYSKAEARVIQDESSWYSTKSPATKVGTEPEWLAVDCIEDIEVTEEMVEIAENEFLEKLHQTEQIKRAANTKTLNHVGTLEPKSIIKRLDLYVHLENVPYLRSALGAIEDLAEGCYISSGTTTENHVNHTIDTWSIVYEEDLNGNINMMKGALTASISTFGLPQGHTGNPEENKLYVKLLLVDNKTIIEQTFNIGDLIADLNEYDGTQLDENGEPIWPELHLVWPEPLPEVEPVNGGNSGFDVGVGEWGDEIVTELPLM